MNRRQLIKSLLITGTGITLNSPLVEIWSSASSVRAVDRDLAALTEFIIPETDSPGAIAAGVPQFISIAIHKTPDPAYANKFISDLKNCMDRCTREYTWSFQYLAEDQKRNFLESLAEFNDPFFNALHTWTVVGYFTSEVGMTKALTYNPIPGSYDPCVEVTDATRGEATYF